MEKINLVELLKDCPKGMELDCTVFKGLEFDHIDENSERYPIICRVKTEFGSYNIHTFTEYGCYSMAVYSKCVIFPKGKTTWEGFQRPFKDGDIVFYNDTIAIFKEWGDETLFRTYVTTYLYCDSFIDIKVPLFGKSVRKEIRFATEEEKQRLFQAIKDNGYKWNPETKTLEKLIEPKFKVGDRIKSVISSRYYTVVDIKNNIYFIKSAPEKYPYQVSFEFEINYELVPNKFDINTLVPFESKVLVRNANNKVWRPTIFGCYMKDKYEPFYVLGGTGWKQCIPYNDDTKHLLGKTNDCSEFYKNWK